MSDVWDTKYGKRRVRHDPPEIAEAIAAAQGLSDDPGGAGRDRRVADGRRGRRGCG